MKILYTREHDGGLSVIYAASKPDIERLRGPLTEADYRARMWERLVPTDAINAVEIPDDYVLPEREFREAWKQDGAGVGHDLVKAKDIQLDRVRVAREPKLAELDREYMLEDEKGAQGNKPDVTARKKLLRDITEPLKALVPTSIQDIKDAFPESLRSEA